MLSSRTSAARRLRRFLAPTSLSVLLHVFFVLQAAPALRDPPVVQAPIDVYLTPDAERDPEPAPSKLAPPRSAVPGGKAPELRPSARPGSGTRGVAPDRPSEPALETVVEPAPALQEYPLRPPGLEPVELAIVPAPQRERGPGEPDPRPGIDRPAEAKSAVAPLYHQPPGAEKSGSMPPPAAGTGMGVSFDFWSPPVFEEEMARATEKIGRAEAEHLQRKNTDLGHGVICNEGKGWFVCAHDDIARCNRDRDGNCRYAKPVERYQLEVDHIF